MTPAIIVGHGMLQGSVVSSEEWRRHGETRRKELLEQDKLEGGTSFEISKKCNVKHYFEIGDRVLAQFRRMYEHRQNLEEIYVMGCRLVDFYQEALPTHPGYHSIDPRISNLREKSVNDLDWIRKRLEVIALRVDELELNRFIVSRQRKVKQSSRRSSSHTVEPASQERDDTPWESFSGWSADFGSNDENLLPTQLADAHEINKIHDEDETYYSATSELPYSSHLLVEDPGTILDLESDDEDNETDDGESGSDSDFECSERAVVYEFATDDEYNSSFLRAIAEEEVEFETDSDAVDSWAQDDDGIDDNASSSSDDMVDEILNRVLIKRPSYDLVEEHSDDELENVNPESTKDCSLHSYPSFDEPADGAKDDTVTSSPSDVMSFDRLQGDRRSDEETMPLYFPGLRV